MRFTLYVHKYSFMYYAYTRNCVSLRFRGFYRPISLFPSYILTTFFSNVTNKNLTTHNRTICTTVANQQLSLLGRTCFTRPTQDRVAASLSIVQTLICSSDEDLWQTGRIHPDFPCPPISVLQPPPLTRANLYFYERHL